MNKKVGIVGIGKMGGGIAKRFIEQKVVLPQNLILCEKVKEKLIPFQKEGTKICSIQELAKLADLIIIAVEPHDLKAVLEGMKDNLTSSKVIVSIVAGVSISYISRIIKIPIPIIRVMPNTAVVIGEGVCAFCKGKQVTQNNLEDVTEILSVLGELIEIPEENFDAVTGLSGSGPAFVYLAILGLIKGGEKAGLSEELARRLALKTFIGASKLALCSNKDLRKLISSVATPGGTTVEGLKVLEQNNFVDTLAEAVVRAAWRAREISIEIESKI